MASNEQIQRAIQTSANAGAASGYAQALEDLVGNLRNQAQRWQSEHDASDDEFTRANLVGSIQTALAIAENIAPELERRKAVADRELKSAAAHSQLVAVVPSWQVALARRIIDASHLRPVLVQALGGADSRRAAP